MKKLDDWEQNAIRKVIADFGSAVEAHGQVAGGALEDECFRANDAADKHVSAEEDGGEGCAWVVPADAEVREVACMVVDRRGVPVMEEGFNVHGAHCKCGKFKDVTLRYFGGRAHLENKGVL